MLTFIGGIVALLVGVWLWTLPGLFALFVKALLAVIPIGLVLGGIVAIIAGISSIKEKAAEKKETSAPAPPAEENK